MNIMDETFQTTLRCGCIEWKNHLGYFHNAKGPAFQKNHNCFNHDHADAYCLCGTIYPKKEWEEIVSKELIEVIKNKIIKCYILCDSVGHSDSCVKRIADKWYYLGGNHTPTDEVWNQLGELTIKSAKWRAHRHD